MFGFSRYDKHADLMTRMADKAGVDIANEVQYGNIAESDLRTMVTQCIGCAEAATCERWLEADVDTQETPDYCRNKDLFSMLTHAAAR